jgi:hypothetical protein
MTGSHTRNVWNWGDAAPQRKTAFLFPKEGEGVMGICTQQMLTTHGMSVERREMRGVGNGNFQDTPESTTGAKALAPALDCLSLSPSIKASSEKEHCFCS